MKVKLLIVIGMLSLVLCACGDGQHDIVSGSMGESIVNQESIQESESSSIVSQEGNLEKPETIEDLPTENMEITETPENLEQSKDEVSDYSAERWYSAYQTIIDDWKTIEQYGDFEYLKMYFDKEYQFDNYWLCDVNSDGTPELFLHSDYMNITSIFTYYEDEIHFLMYDVIYGINKETGDIVIEGHWHGAGGSGVDEWTIYHITESEAVYAYYIDFYREYEEMEIDKPYTVYDVNTGEYERQSDSKEYDAIHAAYVKPCILKSKYQRYELEVLSGLNVIQ